MPGSGDRRTIRVGTRGSALAMRQAGIVVDLLARLHPSVEFVVTPIRTPGDRNRTSPIASLGVGVFVKELEAALLDGRIDMAVHSLKDMPSELGDEFVIAAVPERADPRDVLVSRGSVSLVSLPEGARLGTGSPRRRAQVLAARPDLRVLPLRGNIDTRIAATRGDDLDAAVLAAAGLERTGRSDDIAEWLDVERFVPAVGQGALAVETWAEDDYATGIAAQIDHQPTRRAVTAERSFLAGMGGGCAVPFTAHARPVGDRLTMSGFAADPDGVRVVRGRIEGPSSDAAKLGRRLAKDMLARGAGDLVAGQATAEEPSLG